MFMSQMRLSGHRPAVLCSAKLGTDSFSFHFLIFFACFLLSAPRNLAHRVTAQLGRSGSRMETGETVQTLPLK